MKKTIILALIFVFIVVSGLSCSLPFGKSPGKLDSMADYRKGTAGLEVSFDKMIKEVPEDNPFQIPVKLKNMGASDIKSAFVLIEVGDSAVVEESSGFTIRDEKGALSEKKNFNKRSPTNPSGEEEYLFLNAKAESAGIEDSVSSEIRATACFDYTTHAQASVCIDPGQYEAGRIGAKACEVKPISLSGGQGGPLAVTKIEYSMLHKDKDSIIPYFEITIQNQGKGDVFKPAPKEAGSEGDFSIIESGCLGALGERRNRAYVSASLFGEPQKLYCDIQPSEGQSPVKFKEAYFKDGETIVTCTGEPILKKATAYLTPLDIYIDYGYVTTTKTTVKIKNIRIGNCYNDYPLGSKCNDLDDTPCGSQTVTGFLPDPVPTRDCKWGCCIFKGD